MRTNASGIESRGTIGFWEGMEPAAILRLGPYAMKAMFGEPDFSELILLGIAFPTESATGAPVEVRRLEDNLWEVRVMKTPAMSLEEAVADVARSVR